MQPYVQFNCVVYTPTDLTLSAIGSKFNVLTQGEWQAVSTCMLSSQFTILVPLQPYKSKAPPGGYFVNLEYLPGQQIVQLEHAESANWLVRTRVIDHPPLFVVRNSIYNLALSWCQWDLWCYSYSYRSIICQCQQYIRAERSAVRTCSTKRFRRDNRTRSRRTKTMKRSTACLLGYNQQYERSVARSCLAERSGVWVEKKHGKGEKHDDNLYTSSGTSQSNHPPSVFTSNTL